MSRTLYYGKVLDVNDPANLGRIRCVPQDWLQSSYTQGLSVEDEARNTNGKWSINDPFLVYPLLPIFLYQVPKIDEFVHVVFYDNKKQENNRFYIQGTFSNFDSMYKDEYKSMVAGLAAGERNKEVGRNIITPQTLEATKTENNGLYPNPGTVALLGRKNSDILLPENGVMLRTNKEFRNPQGVTFNKNYSFSMLQTYPSKTTETEVSTSNVTLSVYQNLRYLIEYNVYGGMGTIGGKYSAYIEVYAISPYKKVSTSAFTTNEFVEITDESKLGPIYRKDFISTDFRTIVNACKGIIKNLNNNNRLGIQNEIQIPLPAPVFPFVYSPSIDLFNLSIKGTEAEKTNAKNFIRNIFLNQTQSSPIYGLVSEKDTMGILKQPKEIKTETPKPTIGATTVNMAASNFHFFLSHDTQVGVNRINFQDAPITTGNTIDEGFIWNTVYPNTNSMVRGEKLLELLEKMAQFMISHVHPYHGMPPVPTSMGGVTSQEILTKIFNGYQEILNQNLRLN